MLNDRTVRNLTRCLALVNLAQAVSLSLGSGEDDKTGDLTLSPQKLALMADSIGIDAEDLTAKVNEYDLDSEDLNALADELGIDIED